MSLTSPAAPCQRPLVFGHACPLFDISDDNELFFRFMSSAAIRSRCRPGAGFRR